VNIIRKQGIIGVMMKPLLSFVIALCAVSLFGGWGEYLDPPSGYASFERRVEKLATYSFPDFDVEEYRQANWPDTFQRLMMAVPKNVKGRIPAVVVPFYYPEAMLGVNPKTGDVNFHILSPKTNLTYFSEITYMRDLARRGYVAVTAEAYYLTYVKKGAPESAWKKWAYAGERLVKDHPGWTGIGKLAFDTRLLVDLVASDPRVDASRIGIIGHSLGGKMAFYAGCLDPRVKVIVASDFGIGWDQTNWGDIWYWGGKLKDVRAKGLDHSDLLSLAGGKPFCLIAGKADNEDSGIVMRRAKGYESCPERLKLVNHATGHRPPRSATETGYRFLDKYLKDSKAR
jgi:dienelactone hydrolase